MAHALYSPSGFDRWGTCPGSTSLTKDYPRTSSIDAATGTCAHHVVEQCLRQRCNADTFIGEVQEVDGFTIDIDADMAAFCQAYLDQVRAYPGTRVVEQKLPISDITGEEGAHGTADCVILTDDELLIVDFKYGMGVKVSAERNSQLMIYALAAMSFYDWYGPFQTIRLVIHQPRLDHIDEWTTTPEELIAFGKKVRQAVEASKVPDPEFVPSEKACRFCPAKATCNALTEYVYAAVTEDFVDLDNPLPKLQTAMSKTMDNAQLAKAKTAIDLIKNWIKAIEEAVELELMNGRDVPGYKLIQGKRGARKWVDEENVKALFFSTDLDPDDFLTVSVISPTTAEKLLKGTQVWDALSGNHITQPQGKPTVASMADKRPAISIDPTFEDLTA